MTTTTAGTPPPPPPPEVAPTTAPTPAPSSEQQLGGGGAPSPGPPPPRAQQSTDVAPNNPSPSQAAAGTSREQRQGGGSDIDLAVILSHLENQLKQQQQARFEVETSAAGQVPVAHQDDGDADKTDSMAAQSDQKNNTDAGPNPHPNPHPNPGSANSGLGIRNDNGQEVQQQQSEQRPRAMAGTPTRARGPRIANSNSSGTETRDQSEGPPLRPAAPVTPRSGGCDTPDRLAQPPPPPRPPQPEPSVPALKSAGLTYTPRPHHVKTSGGGPKNNNTTPKPSPAQPTPSAADNNKRLDIQIPAEPVPSKDSALEIFLHDYPELKFFLQVTGWYDPAKKASHLASYYEFIQIEERRNTLIESMRKSGLSVPDLVAAEAARAPASAPEPPSAATPSNGQPPKRAVEDDREADYPRKASKTESGVGPGPYPPSHGNSFRAPTGPDGYLPARTQSPTRYHSPSTPFPRRDRPEPRPLAERVPYDSHRGVPHQPSDRPLPHPQDRRNSRQIRRPDIGRFGESKFFVVKSFNEENVQHCMDDGLWTTQIQNGEMLADAFQRFKCVILFFSVNRSKRFQGYARMVTGPHPDIPRPRWMRGIHWETSDVFQLEWLNTTGIDFWRIHHLQNVFNESQPVLVGKDGQEIEENCARDLLRLMDMEADFPYTGRRDHGDDLARRPGPPPHRPRSRSRGRSVSPAPDRELLARGRARSLLPDAPRALSKGRGTDSGAGGPRGFWDVPLKEEAVGGMEGGRIRLLNQ